MSTVTIERYKPGFFEGIFLKLAYKFPKFGTEKVNVFMFISVMFKLTRQFFHRTWNKIKAIRFDKLSLKFYFHHMMLNLMFFLKGLIGLISLGLFSPNLTGKATTRLARARRDVSDARAERVLEEVGEEELDEQFEHGEKSKVSKIQKNRIRRSKMSDEELNDEIDQKLAAFLDENDDK
jgi:hypothetical protein